MRGKVNNAQDIPITQDHSTSLCTHYFEQNSIANKCYLSHRPIPTVAISPNSQEQGIQGQRVAEIRDYSQIPSQEARLQRDRLGLLLCE